MMHPDEVTLAEMLAAAGYRTGIFGKWHLGDNAPLRPIDQGFQQSLVIKGGGIGQPSDPPGGSSYFDPILQHNGKAERVTGYCSDIFAERRQRVYPSSRDERPFFAYLAFNCPHDPLLAPEPELATYRAMNLVAQRISPARPADPAGVRGARRDGRAGLRHGHQHRHQRRQGVEGSRSERAWPATRSSSSSPITARPRCGSTPACAAGRGRSTTAASASLVSSAGPGHFPPAAWSTASPPISTSCPRCSTPAACPPRPACASTARACFRCSRGSRPPAGPTGPCFSSGIAATSPSSAGPSPRGRNRTSSCGTNHRRAGAPKVPPLELYDMERDPLELHDIATQHPETLTKMYAEYKAWFKDVSSTRGFQPVRIALGSPRENPTILTRQDWRGPRAGEPPDELGFWEVDVARPARFDITLHSIPRRFPTTAHIAFGGTKGEQALAPGQSECTFRARRRCRRGRAGWKPGSRGTRPRPACST